MCGRTILPRSFPEDRRKTSRQDWDSGSFSRGFQGTTVGEVSASLVEELMHKTQRLRKQTLQVLWREGFLHMVQRARCNKLWWWKLPIWGAERAICRRTAYTVYGGLWPFQSTHSGCDGKMLRVFKAADKYHFHGYLGIHWEQARQRPEDISVMNPRIGGYRPSYCFIPSFVSKNIIQEERNE